MGGTTKSTLLSGTSYGKPYGIFFDTDFDEVEAKIWSPTGVTDFANFVGCTSDYANNKIAFATDGDHLLGFHS